MPNHNLSRRIKNLAASLGFDRCGIARAEAIGRKTYLRTWLDSGRAGSMTYLHHHFKTRLDPRELLEGAKSVIVVALLYHQQSPPEARDQAGSQGRVAMYAWGDDYHRVIKAKLHKMAENLS